MVRRPNAGHRGKTRPRNKRFLVYSGGIVTEVEYFQYVRQHLFGDYVRNLRIKSGGLDDPVRVEADGVDPKTLVDGAAKLLREDKKDAKKESYDPFAVVWAVTDVDDFGKNGDKLRAAVDKGHRSGVEVIISNPCFDVWLIDHKQSCPLSYTQTPECESLAKNLGLIDMSRNRNNPKHICQEAIAGKYAKAAKNAQKHMSVEHRGIRDSRPSSGDYAPWTDVPKIVDTLIEEYKALIGEGEEETL
ncbi:MAG TPA: RloB domain-containing protein [Oribacterium sp.]|nr:RloB domain-containing protein [Oribacterium sp.]